MMGMELKSRFKVEDEAQASALHQLSEIGVYDFWTEVSKIILGMFQCYRMLYFQAVPGRSVDIRTSPEETEQLGVWLEQHGITWSVMIEDVGVLMEAEKASSGKRSDSAHSMDWTSYHALEDIYGWLDVFPLCFVNQPCVPGLTTLIRPLTSARRRSLGKLMRART